MKKRILRTALLVFICFFVMTTVVLAGNGGGSGDGSGGGKGEPLKLVSSSIKDGSKDVPTNLRIKLEFSKNVTFDTVRAGNEKAISMEDSKGNPVDINVILAESTNRDERNFVVVEAKGLKNGSQYTLKVAKSMESKSGENLEAPIKINFTTVAAGKAVENPKTGDDILTYVSLSFGIILLFAYRGIQTVKESAQ